MIVIVTRPAHAGHRLFDRVLEQGHETVWWPAFEIGAAPDPIAARNAVGQLAEYQLAVFVSATAVSATRALLHDAWPAQTLIGAVGPSTRAAVEAELGLAAGSIMIAPSDAGGSGSESFWNAWQASGCRAQNVLLLRAADGRDWLSERFVESGAVVNAVAVYSRVPRQLSTAARAQLEDWISQGVCALTIFSSTEAVGALDAQVGADGQNWLRAGIAVACHPRIGDRLSSNGYARVWDATFDDDSIIAKLELIRAG